VTDILRWSQRRDFNAPWSSGEDALRKSHLLSPHIERRTALRKTARKLGIGLHHANHHAGHRERGGNQTNRRSDGNRLTGLGFGLSYFGGAGEQRLAATLRLGLEAGLRLDFALVDLATMVSCYLLKGLSVGR
jgi:hypothetical protein